MKERHGLCGLHKAGSLPETYHATVYDVGGGFVGLLTGLSDHALRLTPDEARFLAACLEQAAQRADEAEDT